MVTRPTLKGRALALGLHGVVANWDGLRDMENLEHFIEVEKQERQRRGLARRYRNARLGRFKPMPDFDWDHPEAIDRALVRGPGQRPEHLAQITGVSNATITAELEALVAGSLVALLTAKRTAVSTDDGQAGTTE